MAIWQFKFALVPANGIKRVCGNAVKFLPEYQGRQECLVVNNEVYKNYWEGYERYLEQTQLIENILPQSGSWSNEAKMFGDPEGDRIEIWSDDIECAVDLRNFSAFYLQAVLNLAIKLDCKLVLHGSGEIVNPVWADVIEKIKASRAYYFCENPTNFFRNFGDA